MYEPSLCIAALVPVFGHFLQLLEWQSQQGSHGWQGVQQLMPSLPTERLRRVLKLPGRSHLLQIATVQPVAKAVSKCSSSLSVKRRGSRGSAIGSPADPGAGG